jgi:hypothetical protein
MSHSNVTYTTSGDVRGDCGHRHRTMSGAARCRRDDQRYCHGQGGYSDREIYYADGTELTDADLRIFEDISGDE